ncbi:P-loop containing nucleoside triphosphate hydrolase protein, partial [Epithele typhae]|uniref:P-loop containing nucleoside triphosphate hydrolase protein n=1 Tax=Epithele typhae TaxID=378194 RepID=UPI002008B8DC
TTPAIGVSYRISEEGHVDLLALATPHAVFSIALRQDLPRATQIALARLLDDRTRPLAGFSMGRVALHLHRRLGAHVVGVDLGVLLGRGDKPASAAECTRDAVSRGVPMGEVHQLWCEAGERSVCLRAWLSAMIAHTSCELIRDALKVDTRNLPAAALTCLAVQYASVERVEALRPTQTEGEVEEAQFDEEGRLVVRNKRFKTRVRASEQVVVETETQTFTGRAVTSSGRATGLFLKGGPKVLDGSIVSVRVVGREEATNAERARDGFIFRALRGETRPLASAHFVNALWFTEGQAKVQKRQRDGASVFHPRLNGSQKEVVEAMLDPEEMLVVAHGPPGTGKTSTIAVALGVWSSARKPVWVVAQSNVGAKNIARTLIKPEYAINFKLIVSKDFHFEWHEHLYGGVEDHLIVSDDLTKLADTVRMLDDSQVVVCTLSMLSNPALDGCGLTDLVPVERLVIDEASQIDSFELMHLFYKFNNLQKVCMFGDPKQLPPYGKENTTDMKTIFDFKHLKPAAYFLNTQYRMPVLLGEFISKEVYNSKLRSEHSNQDSLCIRFVDVRKGEEGYMGGSWQNLEEARAIVNLVKNYYRPRDFCIITPYDAQRNLIENQLKAASLPWDYVYNVDSFQ